jgi:hypothetical protein
MPIKWLLKKYQKNKKKLVSEHVQKAKHDTDERNRRLLLSGKPPPDDLEEHNKEEDSSVTEEDEDLSSNGDEDEYRNNLMKTEEPIPFGYGSVVTPGVHRFPMSNIIQWTNKSREFMKNESISDEATSSDFWLQASLRESFDPSMSHEIYCLLSLYQHPPDGVDKDEILARIQMTRKILEEEGFRYK